MKKFVLGFLALGTALTQSHAINVLVSGGQFDATAIGYIQDMGHTVTSVAPTAFSSQSFVGFDAIYLDWQSTYTGLSTRTTDLMNFAAAGGNILAEITLVSGNPLPDYPFGGELNIAGTHANNVRIVDGAHPVMNGLTSASLSNWGNSHHGHYTSNIGSFHGLADTGNAGEWVAVTKQWGFGNITYSTIDAVFHMKFGGGATGASSPKGIFINNALTLAAVPEASTYALLAGLLGFSFVVIRRRSRSQSDVIEA